MSYELSRGSHTADEQERCAMEWVAHMAGEVHSANPRCVSPVLRAYTMGLNDLLGDEPRQQLRPYLGRLIGTRDDGHDKDRAAVLYTWLGERRQEDLGAQQEEWRRRSEAAGQHGRSSPYCFQTVAEPRWPVLFPNASRRAELAVVSYVCEVTLGVANSLSPMVDASSKMRCPIAFELLDKMLPTEILTLPPVTIRTGPAAELIGGITTD